MMMLLAMVVTFLAMTPLSIYFHGELTRDYAITGALTCLAAGSAVCTVTVRALAAFGQLEDEQEHLWAQLFEAQKHEAIAHLASGVAHDFNNLLQTVLANTSFLEEGLASGETLGRGTPTPTRWTSTTT